MTAQFSADQVDVRAWAGRVLGGKYRLEQCVGRSGDTLVYRARQLNLGRDVAVKILFSKPTGSMQLGDRLRREARLVASLRHPGLAEMYDEGVTVDGRPYIVMELLRGRTLEDVLTARPYLEPDEAVDILLQLAAVLGAVHAAGYVHRDLKPTNIFLEPNGSGYAVKLIDFGTVRAVSARFADDSVAKKTLSGLGNATQIHTLPGVVFGTPSYMSPEQCRGEELDSTTDIYSLGVVLYRMLTGWLPFEDVQPVRVMARHMVEPPPQMSQRAPDVAGLAAFEPVVARALAKDRRERFQSAHAFARAAVHALAGVEYPTKPIPLSIQRGARAANAVSPRAARPVQPARQRAEEPTRPMKRSSLPKAALSPRWIVVTTVLSLSGFAAASVFAILRSQAGEEPMSTVPPVARSAVPRERPQSAAAYSGSHPGDAPSPTSGRDEHAASMSPPGPTASYRTGAKVGAPPAPPRDGAEGGSETERRARRFGDGLNGLMKPRSAQER